MEPPISQRKADHLALAASGRADHRGTTLLEDVHLVHQALPEVAVDDVDLSTTLLGRRLALPLVITGMTGGTGAAGAINRDLARAAAVAGVAFGVGSQRAMALHPELEASFQVKDAAPDVFLIGNLGAVQVRELGPARVADLVARIGADALAVHLNPAQELIQDHGDRDFRGALAAIGELARGLPVPVIVKETGCGLSREAAEALAGVGIRAVDVAGAGGTSWVAVEAQRAAEASPARALGEELWDWGVPTAVSVALAARAGLEVVASGGVRHGLDVARALALGARAGGMAAPALRAQQAGGVAAVGALLDGLARSLRTIAVLTGCARVRDLAAAPRHLGPTLRGWIMISAALGKVILLGEHAVVHGHPALAAAIDRGLRVSFEGRARGPIGLTVPHWGLTAACGDGSPVGEALERLAGGVGADHLSLDLNVVAELPAAAGLGSSAALVVGLTRALAAAAGRKLEADRLIAIALEGERVFHGNPSGVDVTLSARGGVGVFRRGHGLTALAAPPLTLVIGLSGERRQTAGMVERVRDRLAAGGDAPAALARLGQAAEDGAAALVAGDHAALGALFQLAQRELAGLGVSSRGLDLLVSAALEAGALGAKLTGAGGGGAVIALAPGREREVVAAWTKLGRQAFVAIAGGPP